VDTVYWLPMGGSVAQASWLGSKVGSHPGSTVFIAWTEWTLTMKNGLPLWQHYKHCCWYYYYYYLLLLLL